MSSETDLEWSSSGDKESQPSNTTVLSSKDVRIQESTYDAVLHGAHSGNTSEHRYSTNDTRAPGIISLSDDEHYSTTPATFFNESAENEELNHLSPVDQSGQRSNSATNTSSHDVLKIPIPPTESYHEKSSQTDLVSKEESTQNPLHAMYPEWSSEESNTSSISSEETVPGVNASSENDHSNESFYTVTISIDEINYEDSTHETLMNETHPDWNNENQYSTNISKDVLHDIASSSESNYENNLEASPTEISGGSHNEEHRKNHTMLKTEYSEWDSEEQYFTNTSGDNLQPGVAYPGESEHEQKSSHTAVTSSDNGKQEDYTEDPLLHSTHPGQDSDGIHPTNSTRVDDFYGIIVPSERKHEKEDTAYTAVSSSDDVREENATHDSTVHDQLHEWSKEEKYSPNSTVDEVLAGIIPSAGNNEEKYEHTGWDSGEKHLINTSRDSILIRSDTIAEKEHDVLYTDEVSQGVYEDSTPEPVRDSEDKYTTKSTAPVFHGIVPRRGINQKNKTDHTVVVSEESTQDPQLYGIHLGRSDGDEHLINNTENSVVSGVFPEIDSDFDRRPASSFDSSNPDEHENGITKTRGQNVTPVVPKKEPRKADIPDWLIVVASLLALALILGVCIAVNSRRRCGQKQKLIINNGKGGIDEKNVGGLNGEASKSHEMVHLVHNEKSEDQIGPHDEFLAIDETQNQQEVALKSGM
uniref:Uncharacterized protein n=1 Tax=Salvator merianae TaxID=96440 RepID=A0A8D0BB39_SALMN